MTHPTQYPFPVAQRGSVGLRSLRGPLGSDMRQPDLGGAPNVVSISGFGGGGAYIRNNGAGADKSQGLVIVQCGLAPAATGTIVLNFGGAVTAANYWAAADWASIALAGGANLTLTWTASRMLNPLERLVLAYQWAVST
jgi:hypothetical protein